MARRKAKAPTPDPKALSTQRVRSMAAAVNWLESFSICPIPLRALVNQVVFVLLTYSLLQRYLLRIGREELNPKTRTRTLELLRGTLTVIVIYYQKYMAFLTALQHQELILTLSEPARKKILGKTRRLRRTLAHQFDHARPR